jgi:hypothetical protein
MPSASSGLIDPELQYTLILSATIMFPFVLLVIPKRGLAERLLNWFENCLSAFAQRKALAIVTVFFAVICLRLALLRQLPVPAPGIHDEFSYLLMGDTFAHGRLTNPSHPLWRSFDTFHVNWLPTYSSIYPPAQGLVLALGQLVGNPWLGVVVSNAAMCAAILWMLQGWMPSRWALLGAILAAIKLSFASYWMNSYWGGAVAAIGGALVLGAIPRIRRKARPRDAVILAVGVALLANNRPFEGALLCIPVTAWLIFWMAGRIAPRIPLSARLRRVAAPLLVVLFLTAGAMAFYNWRLTGNALLLPYTLNIRAHVTAPLFLWQHAKPALHYDNQQFEDFYNQWERAIYDGTWRSAWSISLVKWTLFKSVFFWFAALLLLPAFAFVFRDKKMRLLLAVFFIVSVGLFAVVWSNPHYAAPITCIIFAFLAQSIRHLRTLTISSRPLGAALSRAVVVLLVLQVTSTVRARQCDPIDWVCNGNPARVALLRNLSQEPGKHLIIVRYAKGHNIHSEWVFNGADIDGANILWARELDAEQNAKLIYYFRDRHIWLFQPDFDDEQLLPYAAPVPRPAK